MRKIYLSLFLLFLFVTGAKAQDNTSINYPMSIGPFVTFKGGVNAAEVPKGYKNGITFNGIPDFGAIWYQPLRKEAKFGVLAELAYSTYAYILKPYTQPNDPKYVQKLHYLTLGGELYTYGFTIGFNTGIIVSTESEFIQIDEDNISPLLEIRIGGMIPLVSSQTGRLNLMIRGGYHLFGVYDDNKLIGSSGYNLHPASVELGLNYLFHLYKKGEAPQE